jgi:hypothetical protein
MLGSFLRTSRISHAMKAFQWFLKSYMRVSAKNQNSYKWHFRDVNIAKCFIFIFIITKISNQKMYYTYPYELMRGSNGQ